MSDLPASASSVTRTLLGASSVVLCAHVNPDGDAIGSLLGLTHALRAAGIDATPTLADDRSAPVLYAFLPGFPLLRSASTLEPPDVFVALDTPVPDRLGTAEALARAASTTVVIDHHPDPAPFGDVRWVDTGASAVGQMVWRLLPGLGIEPTAEIATCLYVALMTDTGRFSYGNTDETALREAADMVAAGADPFALYSRVYESQSAAAMRLLGLVLSRVTLANDGRVAYSWVSDDDVRDAGGILVETENLVDAVRSIGAVDVAFLVKCVDGDCRVSLRSKTGSDVGTIARHFGGGGHSAAAGYTSCCCPEDTVAALLPLLPGGDEA